MKCGNCNKEFKVTQLNYAKKAHKACCSKFCKDLLNASYVAAKGDYIPNQIPKMYQEKRIH